MRAKSYRGYDSSCHSVGAPWIGNATQGDLCKERLRQRSRSRAQALAGQVDAEVDAGRDVGARKGDPPSSTCARRVAGRWLAAAAAATAATAATAASATATPRHLLQGAAVVFLVEQMECRQAYVRDFLLAQRDRLCRREVEFLRRVRSRCG